MGYADQPVGYDGARMMIEHELTGLRKICDDIEIGMALYDYYLQAWINPQYRGHRAEAALDALETHLPVYSKTFGADAVKAALRGIYNERYAREGRAL